MNTEDLMWFLSEVPVIHREKTAKMMGLCFDKLTVYHITKINNVENIKKNGIVACSSRQSYDRPDAVYFFVDRDEINKTNLDILGLSEDHIIITIEIPYLEVIKRMHWDGLYNVTFGTSATAVQYFGNIPVEWINL